MLCAVSFNRYGRLYYLDPGEFRPQVGDRVLVPTDDGPEVAECVWAAQWVDEDTSGFPTLAGIAGEDDLRRDELLRRRKAEAKEKCEQMSEALVAVTGAPLRPVYVLLDGEEDAAEAGGAEDLDHEALVEKLKSEFNAEEVG